ncbi:TRAP transporter permease [Spiractinospora alimapuensis]|uniref:TRAP transporter permease n=1 Tax=Spiractinospora alimapuensis TaxID=2820884 RepID=UPI001F3314B9|nr:TRAP transporter permease [Spiractinospora alimapuensis]QVQ50062.1 TRAP transporter permease [Spiractinospora alimapuensis]
MTEDTARRPPAQSAAPPVPPSGPTQPDVDSEGDGRPLWERLATERWGEGRLASVLGIVVLVIAVLLGLYQIYSALFVSLDAYLHRVTHLLFVLVLVFLVKPAGKGAWAKSTPMGVVDFLLAGTAAVVSLYPLLNFGEIVQRMGQPTGLDLAMGVVAILVVLEACRRVIGLFMSVLVAGFLFYAWIGPLLPGDLAHRGYTYQRITYHSYLFQEGIYGVPLGVAATFIFVFLLFGALLQKSGGGNFLVGLAMALTGRSPGGPAKGAVVGSGLVGSVSGSAIANVAITGSFTIPMMRRVGFKGHQAGGVEAASSTGGQLLPPIMGAGAFVMAEFLGVPYTDVVKIAIIPALMYFLVVYLFVDIIARKNGLTGMPKESLPRVRDVMASGFHFLIPLVVLTALLLLYWTPLRAGMVAIGVLLLVAMVRAASRLGFWDILEVFVIAARNTLLVSVACAAAGIIVGIVGLTGLGLRLSSYIVGAGGGYLFLTLLLIALASLIMGLGMPVTASYIVLSVLAVPALGELGLSLVVAHMIVYWYSQDSNVTPPVALAAFSAAAIAGSGAMRTSVSAWKYAKGLYLIPLLMAYTPLLLNGSLAEIISAVITGCLALFAFAVCLEGYFLRATTLLERVGLGAATMALILSSWLADYFVNLLPGGLAAAITQATASIPTGNAVLLNGLSALVVGAVIVAHVVAHHRHRAGLPERFDEVDQVEDAESSSSTQAAGTAEKGSVD